MSAEVCSDLGAPIRAMEAMMTLSSLSRMLFSPQRWWDEFVNAPPSINRLIALVVLPISLMPPVMIYYPVTQYADGVLPAISPDQWHRAARVFLVAELLTIPFLALLIRAVTSANRISADFRDCVRLAALAPIPIWLSSAVLLIPNLIVCLLAGAFALLGSLMIIFRGLYALFRMRNDLRAMQMALLITGVSLLVWLLLIQILLMH